MNECSICLSESILPENECINSCGHSFCKQCLDRWLDQGKKQCPMCRQDIKYFEHDGDKYRLIISDNVSREIARIDTSPHLLKKINILRFTILSLVTYICVQAYTIHDQYASRKTTLHKLNTCLNDNNDFQNIINDNHMINTMDTENMFVMNKQDDQLSYCELPTYYIDQCFT